jgi:hypothetical protein
MAAQKVWGFVHKGRFLVDAYIDANGVVRNTFDRPLNNIVASGWKTRRAVTSILGDTKITVRVSNIVAENIDGTRTDAGEAILGQDPKTLNGQIHSLEGMIMRSHAMNDVQKAALWAKVQKRYAREFAELAAKVAAAA